MRSFRLGLLIALSYSLVALGASKDFASRWKGVPITTQAQAKLALKDAKAELSEINRYEKTQTEVCYKKIFVNSCLNDLKKEVKTRRFLARSVKNEAEAKLRAGTAAQRSEKEQSAKTEAAKLKAEEKANEAAYEKRLKEAQEREEKLNAKSAKHVENVQERLTKHEKEMQDLISAEKASLEKKAP
ncbi:MAG TPA: hypothetical protein DCW60_02150 [Sutterella sp.]|nr:hypothetical protein [Sutterella sp.]